MRSKTLLQLSTGCALLVSLAGSAVAHIELLAPTKRVSGLKTGPCGERDSVRGDAVCEFRPGATITVAWDETIDHPGHYRIAFDEDGDDDFFDPASFEDVSGGPGVLLDGIGDRDVGDDIRYTQEITLPSIECDNCTLQVVQVMTDKAPYGDGNDLYYQCADIVLSASAPEVPAAGCTADEGPGGGADGADGDGAEDGGCAMTGGDRASSGLIAAIGAAVLGLIGRRRRRG